MQQRHSDRRTYFNELARTAQDYYIDYLQQYTSITPDTRILEIGCGEGGNLLPFAQMGCTSHIPYLRNFYSTSAFYLLKTNNNQN